MNNNATQSTLCLEVITLNDTKVLVLAKYVKYQRHFERELASYSKIASIRNEQKRAMFASCIGWDIDRRVLYMKIGPLTTLGEYIPKCAKEVSAIRSQILDGITTLHKHDIEYCDANTRNFIVDGSTMITLPDGSAGPKTIIIDFGS